MKYYFSLNKISTLKQHWNSMQNLSYKRGKTHLLTYFLPITIIYRVLVVQLYSLWIALQCIRKLLLFHEIVSWNIINNTIKAFNILFSQTWSKLQQYYMHFHENNLLHRTHIICTLRLLCISTFSKLQENVHILIETKYQ